MKKNDEQEITYSRDENDVIATKFAMLRREIDDCLDQRWSIDPANHKKLLLASYLLDDIEDFFVENM